MKRSALVSVVCLLVLFPAIVFAQATDLDTWIDTDFDGLPTNAPKTLSVNQPDSFRIYVDLTGFPVATWTNFLYSFSLGPGPDSSSNFFANDTGSVVVRSEVSGFTFNFPENNFDSPFIYQIGGNGSAQNVINGAMLLATVQVRPIRPGPPTPGTGACITPRIASDNPSYMISQFGNQSDYGVFDNGTRTPGCYTISGGLSATDATSWGRLKGLYR